MLDPAEETCRSPAACASRDQERDEVVISRVETMRDDYIEPLPAAIATGSPRSPARLGWSFGTHRTDRPPHLALLALYAALSGDRRR